MGGRWGFSGGVDELGDATKLVVVAIVGGTVAQQLTDHEQRSLCVRRPAADMEG